MKKSMKEEEKRKKGFGDGQTDGQEGTDESHYPGAKRAILQRSRKLSNLILCIGDGNKSSCRRQQTAAAANAGGHQPQACRSANACREASPERHAHQRTSSADDSNATL
jgi:hypothetical protein